MIPWYWFLVLFLASGVAVAGAFHFGHQLGWDDGYKYFKDKVDRLEAVLKAAGLSLDRDLPARLRDVEDPSGSWTGNAIDERYRLPAGTVPRWDEPTRHQSDAVEREQG